LSQASAFPSGFTRLNVSISARSSSATITG
jgi:hypothetical protein